MDLKFNNILSARKRLKSCSTISVILFNIDSNPGHASGVIWRDAAEKYNA